MTIPTKTLEAIIEELENRLSQLRRFANNGPDDHNKATLERWEVYEKLNRDIQRTDEQLIELEQILALVNEYNEEHQNEHS